MTSMFDQYHSTLRRGGSAPVPQANLAPISKSPGVVRYRKTEAAPMFATSRMKFIPKDDIGHMVVCNNRMIIHMNNSMVRMGLVQTVMPPEDVKPFPMGYRVLRMFLDPLGSHLLIVVKSTAHMHNENAELWYLHWTMQEIRKCDRFRGHEITAVAFNHTIGSDATTGAILLGTSRGLIFETELSCLEGADQRRTGQTNWKQVFDIGKGDHCPITGLHLLKVPQTLRHIVFVTTMTRLYKFNGEIYVDEKTPYLHTIFNAYLNVPEKLSDFHEIPHNHCHSSLRFYMDVNIGFPEYFGWLTDSLFWSGSMSLKSDQLDCIVDQTKIPLQTIESYDTVSNKINGPIAFVLTPFHALVAYKDHVTAVSLHDHQIVYEEHFTEQHGPLVDICRDQRSNCVYLVSRKSIFRYKINNEVRRVWKYYLNKNEFQLAQKYCQNPVQMEEILVKQAEQLFANNDFLGAANVYSQTRTSFESVCLRFLKLAQKEALMVFLQRRIETLRPADQTQKTMLIVLLVDLFLAEITNKSINNERRQQMQHDLNNFLNMSCINKTLPSIRPVIYDLMATHSDTTNLTALTTLNRDFEVVINQHINQSAFEEALSVLHSQNKAELFYKYIPVLMEELPAHTGALLRSIKLWLDPERLLPALMCVDTDIQRSEVIQYLEYSIQYNGCRSQAIHNYAIKLYAAYNQDKLMSYLITQGTDASAVMYDINFALRVCLKHEARSPSVFLYCLLGLWHSAVELALQFDNQLATETVLRASDVTIQRALWLRIVEKTIRGSEDVKMALSILNKCDGLLRIEDVLPFFSDFERIDHFKNTICNALKQYNYEICHQRAEMETSAASADQVLSEIKTFRNKSVTISAHDKCNICSGILLQRPFFIFPCGHTFHADCVEKQVDSYNGSSSERHHLANECLLCGNNMIESINRPFVENWDQEASWR